MEEHHKYAGNCVNVREDHCRDNNPKPPNAGRAQGGARDEGLVGFHTRRASHVSPSYTQDMISNLFLHSLSEHQYQPSQL